MVSLEAPAQLFDESGNAAAGAARHARNALRADFDRALVTALTAIAVSSEPETIVLGDGIAKSLTRRLPEYQALTPASIDEIRGTDAATFA